MPVQDHPMPIQEKIIIAPHLVFDAITAGAPGAPLVLLLHAFAESMHCWRAQVTALGDMGYRALSASHRARRHGLSLLCADAARLFARRPPGSTRVFALSDRPPD